ncbi:hypothetical protein KAR91_49225 [Candidatus Pacearchaeota archaeon]|nr:hypothetical protein [Candidatus Pacearchaeota archaeon]
MKKVGMSRVIFGGWYQRTTLHLTEVYAFLKIGKSRLDFPAAKLKALHKKLDLKSVERRLGKLEHIYAVTNSGIKIRYYEDGLYTLEMPSKKIAEDAEKIKKYFDNAFSPAIKYLFSLGAPTPKILSNIKEEHPVVVGIISRSPKSFKIDPKFGTLYISSHSKSTSVYKTEKYIFVVTSAPSEENLDSLIGAQIFFREFKDQLHRYLNIHRIIWEDIADIKEMKEIKGSEIAFYRKKLDSYQKTISLIKYRMNQMGAYAKTRASLSKDYGVEKNLQELFQYRFEDLFNTLAYVKEIWAMTVDYVNSAIDVIKEVGSKASGGGIKSLQFLVSVGVVAGLLRYITVDKLPTITLTGVFYLVILGAIGITIDKVLRRKTKNKTYGLKFIERNTEI